MISCHTEGGFVSATPKSSVSYSGRKQNILALPIFNRRLLSKRLNLNLWGVMSYFSESLKYSGRRNDDA
jgi:hypothetical protein